MEWEEHEKRRFDSPNVAEFYKQYPFYENIRGEKRFKELMEKIRPEWENFEVRSDILKQVSLYLVL